MSNAKKVRRQVLRALYDLYLFPQSERGVAMALKGEDGEEASIKEVRDCFFYLNKKGYVILQPGRDGVQTAAITPAGVDLVEGATSDRGVMRPSAHVAGLAARKAARRSILAYCRQFPDSYNGDDEIHLAFLEQGLTHLLLDQVRFHIWYLSGKELVELKSHPVAGDVVYLARITAAGIDLLDGAHSDDGVAAHG